MKTRIIAAAVLVPLLAITVFWLPLIITAIVFSLLSALAAFELLWGTGLCRVNRPVIYSMVMAAIIPILSISAYIPALKTAGLTFYWAFWLFLP